MSQSVFELTDPFGFDRKQRFWDYFDGDALRSWWTTGIFSGGSPDFTMIDGKNEGFEIDSSSVASLDGGFLWFNDIRQFDPASMRLIVELKALSNTDTVVSTGVAENNTFGTTDEGFSSGVDTATSTSFFLHKAIDSVGLTQVTGTVVLDTNWHRFKIDGNSLGSKYWIDGKLDVIQTTRTPTAKVQPVMFVIQRSATPIQGRIRYLECWNY